MEVIGTINMNKIVLIRQFLDINKFFYVYYVFKIIKIKLILFINLMRTLSIIALVVCITLASGFSSYEKLIQGISLFSNDSEIQNLAKDFIGGVAEGQALTCL